MSISQIKARLLVGALTLVALTGCATAVPAVQPSELVQPSDGGATSVAPSNVEPNSQPPAGGGDAACASWEGKTGVIRVFCTGPATATLTVNGKAHALSGGTCESLDSTVAFNLGVVASNLPDGTMKPDYLGIILDTTTTAASVAYTVDGKADVVVTDAPSLAADRKSGTISGESMSGNLKVSVTFNCG